MTQVTSGHNTGYLPPATNSANRSLPNVSSGWLVMLLSGLLAAVIFFVVTAQSGAKESITVITKRLEIGQTITPDVIGEEKIGVSKDLLERIVTFEASEQSFGFIATTPLEPGDILLKSSIVRPSTPDGRRAMSIAVDKAHAVNGDLRAGDVIDVIDATTTPASYVVQNIKILGVNKSNDASDISIAVSVDQQEAIRLATTIKSGQFDVVRTTGANLGKG